MIMLGSGYMMFRQSELNQLIMWNGTESIYQVKPQHRQVALVLSGLPNKLCNHTGMLQTS